MKLWQNRKFAWLVFVCVVALSILFSGGGALRNDRIDALGVFYADMGIDYDLDARAESAYNLFALAEKYDVAVDEGAETVRQAVLTEPSIAARYQANEALGKAVESLYGYLLDASMSADDRDYALRQYKEFGSRADTIAHNRYNVEALAFNATLSAFPADAIGGLFGVEPLEIFG